jgi:multiple sugar transport system substrate-binding protein
VQPAVRKAMGRDDIWGVGLPMSAAAGDTDDDLLQFELAYGTPWLDRDRRPQFDDPAVRAGIIKALNAYTAIWRKGCTPPDSVNWTNIGNNKAFLAQIVVMTPNTSLSIPGALRTARPTDYYKNAATIDWPDDTDGQPLVIVGALQRAVFFRASGNPALAKDFVRFLAEDGWLAHWLDFAGDRLMPPMRKLVEQPFWLDPSDPHRMRAAIQILTRQHLMNMDVRDHEWQSGPIWSENVWGKAVHRVVNRGRQPRAGGRRGDRPHQGDPERIAGSGRESWFVLGWPGGCAWRHRRGTREAEDRGGGRALRARLLSVGRGAGGIPRGGCV